LNQQTNRDMKNLIEAFGINAQIGKSKGLSVQEVANINKEFAIMTGLSDKQSEDIVTVWVSECVSLGIMN